MCGLLAAQGVRSGVQRIGMSLSGVNPGYHIMRRNRTERQINPVPYRADYFGEKVHVDQNEKLSAFGVTHVCAVDGFSGKIVGFATMPVKNNRLIYEHMYKYVFRLCKIACSSSEYSLVYPDLTLS